MKINIINRKYAGVMVKQTVCSLEWRIDLPVIHSAVPEMYV